MKIIHNYNEDDVLAKLLLMYFAYLHISMGAKMVLDNLPPLQSKYIEEIAYILPMHIWGIILITSGIAFVITVLQENRLEYWFLVLAGVTGGITYSLLAMASLELSTYQSNTTNYIVIASIDFILAIVGGVAVWLRKT